MKTIKYWRILISTMVIIICGSWNLKESDCKNSLYLIERSQKSYDANGDWKRSELKVHIQEPRVETPDRYTKLRIDNASNYFEIERNRDVGLLKIILMENEGDKIFLNGKTEVPQDVKEKYANPERTKRSKNFYRIMYGLPMSLTDTFWKKIEPAQKAEFEGKAVYRINIEPKEELVSKHWAIIISVETYKILAIEFNHPEEPDRSEEILKFHGEYEINGIKIPRVRNWYDKNTHEYLGTDIIVKELE